MKQMIQKLLILAAGLSVGINAFAYDFEANGIYYNILSVQDKTVEVTYREYSNGTYKSDYSGNVVIPEQVTYGDNTYSVTSIGERAFISCSALTSVTIPDSVTIDWQERFLQLRKSDFRFDSRQRHHYWRFRFPRLRRTDIRHDSRQCHLDWR